jgi:hypothetical protein
VLAVLPAWATRRHLACIVPIVDRSPGRRRLAVPLFRPGGLPGPGWRVAAADDLPARASHLAGAVRVDDQLPAHLVQDHVVVPVTVVLMVGEAGVPAVLAVDHVVGLAAGGGLVAAARMLL